MYLFRPFTFQYQFDLNFSAVETFMANLILGDMNILNKNIMVNKHELIQHKLVYCMNYQNLLF